MRRDESWIWFSSSLLVLAVCASSLNAKNWAVGSGNWNVAGNWSPAAVPVGGDAINIVNTDGTPRTVTLDVTTPSLALVSIDLTGVGTAANTLSIPNNFNLTSNALFVGGYNGLAPTAGRGSMTQAAGAVAMVSGTDFVLGHGASSTGTYTLSGTGTFTALQSEFIGSNGTGTFNQSGGTNTINAGAIGYFNMGTSATGKGTYNLSAGQLISNKSEIIGDAGIGTFNQTGGTNTLGGANSLYLANSNGSTGTYTISGNSTLNVGGDMYVGLASSGLGNFNVQGNANVNITGALNIGAFDTVAMSGGTMRFSTLNRNSFGAFNFTGGTVKLGGNRLMNSDTVVADIFGSTPTIASGRNFTVEGTATVGTPSGGTLNVNAANFTSLGSLTVGETFREVGTLNISNGAHVTNAGVTLAKALSSSVGTVSVSGAGTTWTTGNLTVDSGTGNLSITGGAAIVSNDVYIGEDDNTSPSSIVLSGSGSSWTAPFINLGNGYDHPITMDVGNGTLVNLQTILRISEQCSVTLNGGTIHFQSLHNDGSFQFNSGTIGLVGNRTIGADADVTELFGILPTLNAGKGLAVDGTATISSGLTLNGGTFTANSLVVSAPFQFSGGILELTGGAISGIGDLGIPTNGEFRVRGTPSVRVSGAAGSRITATGTLSLGVAGAVNGFATQGALDVGANNVSLLDANDAVFDSSSLVTIGSGPFLGNLDAANGLTLNFGGNITGWGTVSTPNTIAKPTIINGHVIGSNSAQKITMSGYVKGAGTFDNVSFTGTFSPGLSPTTSIAGNIGFSSASTLVMELGGTTAGSQYDQILSSGQIDFAGALQVSLINGFTPAAGQSFNLFDWVTKTGTFSSFSLPTLGGSLSWDMSQLYTTGVLSVASAGIPGDYNNNGTVDSGDYVLYRKNAGTTQVLPNDPTGGTIGAAQYATWRSNFGKPPGSGSGLGGAQVPEPATLSLFAGVVAAAVGSGRRSRSLAKH